MWQERLVDAGVVAESVDVRLRTPRAPVVRLTVLDRR